MVNECLAPDDEGEEAEGLVLDLQWNIPILVDRVNILDFAPRFLCGASHLDDGISSTRHFTLD